MNGAPESSYKYGDWSPGHPFDLVAFLVATGLLLIAAVFLTLMVRAGRGYRRHR